MPARRRPTQPPHRHVVELQRAVQVALVETQQRYEPAALLDALSRGHDDDADGLTELLAELDVRNPSDLVALLRLVTASASYAALSWARGLATEIGERYTAQDVLQAAWVSAELRLADEDLDADAAAGLDDEAPPRE